MYIISFSLQKNFLPFIEKKINLGLPYIQKVAFDCNSYLFLLEKLLID